MSVTVCQIINNLSTYNTATSTLYRVVYQPSSLPSKSPSLTHYIVLFNSRSSVSSTFTLSRSTIFLFFNSIWWLDSIACKIGQIRSFGSFKTILILFFFLSFFLHVFTSSAVAIFLTLLSQFKSTLARTYYMNLFGDTHVFTFNCVQCCELTVILVLPIPFYIYNRFSTLSLFVFCSIKNGTNSPPHFIFHFFFCDFWIAIWKKKREEQNLFRLSQCFRSICFFFFIFKFIYSLLYIVPASSNI